MTNKELTGKAIGEMYNAMHYNIITYIETYIDDIRKENDYIAFSDEVETYLGKLQTKDANYYIENLESLGKYKEKYDEITDGAIELLRDRFSNILGDQDD